jgi:hypothetical protein
MTAITADNTSDFQMKQMLADGYAADLPVAASTAIYKGSLVGWNATGYLTSYVPYAQATAPTGTPFVGIALESVASQTSDGDKNCRVQVKGMFEYPLSAAAQADVGKPVYALDNATLTKLHVPAPIKTGGGYELVGVIVGIPSAGNVLVDMGSPLARSAFSSGLFTVTRRFDVGSVTVDDEVILVHETQNHNGMYLHSCNAYVTEIISSAGGDAIVRIGHTRATGTTLGCTLTTPDGMAANDQVLGVGGCLVGAADVAGAAWNATNAAMILIPADVAVVAHLDTIAITAPTGALDITASFAIR